MPTMSARLTIDALRSILADDDRCHALFARWRFPEGFVCPRCNSRRATELTRRRLWQCHGCRRQVSVTSGTVLHRTRLPLRHWLYAIWMVANRKQSISALQLQKELGLGSYESAWVLLHKVRRALRPDPTRKLRGAVDIGETLLFQTLRRIEGGTAFENVGVVVERRPSSRANTWSRRSMCGELRFRWGHPVDLPQKLLEECTDPRLPDPPRRWGTEAPIVTTILKNLRSWLDGTFHGISIEYLAAYLDEFAWRFNHRAQEPHLHGVLGQWLLRTAWTRRSELRPDPAREPTCKAPLPRPSAWETAGMSPVAWR